MSDGEFNWDSLSSSEAEYAEKIVRDFSSVGWAAPMLAALENAGGIRAETKSFLFELRFADALTAVGIVPDYEVPGQGGSTIDFSFASQGRRWLVELMRLNETSAVHGATYNETDEDGVVWSRRILSSSNSDRRQSLEGETLKAIERICQKCERNGQPHKFPEPGENLHMILVDFRTFSRGGDEADRLHVALGARAVGRDFWLAWEGKLITGVFDPATTLRGAREARERVHFIGFAAEKQFGPGAMAAAIQLIANPYLFENEDEVRAIVASWPLQPATALNLRI